MLRVPFDIGSSVSNGELDILLHVTSAKYETLCGSGEVEGGGLGIAGSTVVAKQRDRTCMDW